MRVCLIQSKLNTIVQNLVIKAAVNQLQEMFTLSERRRLAGNGRLSLSVQAKIVIFNVSYHI
jgi:hypothetical protein